MTKIIRIIGDVHGKYKQYKRLIEDGPPSIQIGDIGVGFRYEGGYLEGEFIANPPHAKMVEGGHRFIRGNHDNPGVCKQQSQWIADGTIEDGVMFVGGALSIDKAFRREGYSWWPDEELSVPELNKLVDLYRETKPRIMITHECPESVAVEMERLARRGKLDPRFASATRQAFESMFQSHSPQAWLFGHWHRDFDSVINGTRFICLNELSYIDFDFEKPMEGVIVPYPR